MQPALAHATTGCLDYRQYSLRAGADKLLFDKFGRFRDIGVQLGVVAVVREIAAGEPGGTRLTVADGREAQEVEETATNSSPCQVMNYTYINPLRAWLSR